MPREQRVIGIASHADMLLLLAAVMGRELDAWAWQRRGRLRRWWRDARRAGSTGLAPLGQTGGAFAINARSARFPAAALRPHTFIVVLLPLLWGRRMAQGRRMVVG